MSSLKVPSRVFLSHTKLDKPFARQLAYDLREAGVEVWLDEWEIRVGDSLREKIESGIQESGWLIVILSPRAVQSQWVQREISAAFTRELDSKRVFILPVLIDKCEIPILLRDKKYANFTRNYIEGLQELLQAVLPSQASSTAPFGELIDVNAHLWMEQFELDLASTIERAREAGVSKIVASACNGPYSWSRSLELAARFTDVYASLALHPGRGTKRVERLDSPTDEEIELLESFVVNPKVVAIGDAQLQYDNLKDAARERQIKIFEKHLALAKKYALPLIAELHGGLEAQKDFLRIMDSGYQDKVHVALQHPVPEEFAAACRERGYYQIIVGNYANPRAENLRRILDMFSQDRILLASDCPWLAPPPLRGRRNEPSYIPHTLAGLRDLKCSVPQELARATTRNALQFFDFEGARYPKPELGPGLRYTFG